MLAKASSGFIFYVAPQTSGPAQCAVRMEGACDELGNLPKVSVNDVLGMAHDNTSAPN